MKPTTTAPSFRTAPPGDRFTPRLWGLLAVLAGNLFIDALEVSTAIVALPSIGRDLGLAPTASQWVVTGFAVGFGAPMLFGRRVVTLLGHRRVYLAALLVFAAASLGGALAGGAALLVATRVVKGCCASLTAPTGLSVIASTFREGPVRDRAVAVYTLFGAAGFSSGLLLSGLLTEVSWRWTFAFPAPVALLLFVLGRRYLPSDGANRPDGSRRYDLAGVVTLTGGVLLLVGAIASAPAGGWERPRAPGCLALAAVLLAAFRVVERRGADPLMRPGAFRGAGLIRSALGAASLNGSYLGLLLLSTGQLQALPGWTPLRAALAFLPASAPLAVSALFSGRLVARFGTARPILAGAAAALLGYALYPRAADPTPYASGVLPSMALVGLGFVLAFAALHTQAVGGVPPAGQAEVSGLYQTAVQLGAAIVPVLVAALLVGGGASGVRAALALVTAVGAVGFAVALTGVVPRRRADR